MEFLNPLMLWSALAVVIPVIIHFWHQKRGQPIPWAATQWLGDTSQQQHRGIRLDNLLLLILRCLVLILLALLLSQPLLNGLNKAPTGQRLHLVQPDAAIVSNFRFELEEALKKGEKVYWVNPTTEPVASTAQMPNQTAFTPLQLQTSINQLSRKGVDLHVYVRNDQSLAELPVIRVPDRFQVHAVVDTSLRKPQPYLSFGNGKKMFVNSSNQLTSQATLPSAIRFALNPAHSGNLSVLLDYRQQAERQTVLAALNALAKVYALDLTIDVKPIPAKKYDWHLTDQEPVSPSPRTLYVVSGAGKAATVTNVTYTPETLTPQTSELVETGQLPEWLGEQLVQHFDLNPNQQPLSQQQLAGLFVRRPVEAAQSGETSSKRFQNILVLFFVGLIGAERWIALRKQA